MATRGSDPHVARMSAQDRPREASPGPLPIPGRANLLILAAAALVSGSALYVASHAARWPVAALAVLVFAASANTLFALLHEAVHGILHPSPAVNRWGGRLAAAFFPTGLMVQRAFHATHHENNRSRAERFEYIHEGDIVWLKYAQWYAILTGVYWLATVGGVVAFLLVPGALRTKLLRGRDSRVATQTSARPYLDALDELPPVTARLELAGTAAFQIGLIWALDLSLGGWLACYYAFGLAWSSLQYTDHAFSPLDPEKGAWNLRVNPLVRMIFLNYHYHLAHHQNPRASWIHLRRLADPRVPQPRFVEIWRSMWRGPRPFPGEADGD